jgi:hypothetical protein
VPQYHPKGGIARVFCIKGNSGPMQPSGRRVRRFGNGGRQNISMAIARVPLTCTEEIYSTCDRTLARAMQPNQDSAQLDFSANDGYTELRPMVWSKSRPSASPRPSICQTHWACFCLPTPCLHRAGSTAGAVRFTTWRVFLHCWPKFSGRVERHAPQ